jgi:hypothetical protein
VVGSANGIRIRYERVGVWICQSQPNNDLKSVMKDVSHDGHLMIPFVYRILVNTDLIYPDVVREASIALRSLKDEDFLEH